VGNAKFPESVHVHRFRILQLCCISTILFGLADIYFGDVNNINRHPINQDEQAALQPCAPFNMSLARKGIHCISKCKPRADQTVEGLGLDINERINITLYKMPGQPVEHEYVKYNVEFPEENVFLRHASEEIKVGLEIHPKAYNERLLRRIIAKLYRAGVLDPTKNIINTGSFIGDNALPWGMMLQQLTENPGKVYAVDPSARFLDYMANIANENSIGNICTHLAIYSSEEKTFLTSSTEHMQVDSNMKKGMEVKAVTLDSENIENLGLLHIDVEGHESELLEGAIGIIATSRPVIVTEGKTGLGSNRNDEKVQQILNTLGYTKSNEINELVGWDPRGRNRIWWPDNEKEAAAMAIVGKEFNFPGLAPWINFELPE